MGGRKQEGALRLQVARLPEFLLLWSHLQLWMGVSVRLSLKQVFIRKLVLGVKPRCEGEKAMGIHSSRKPPLALGQRRLGVVAFTGAISQGGTMAVSPARTKSWGLGRGELLKTLQRQRERNSPSPPPCPRSTPLSEPSWHRN